jgi:MFS family permease
MAFPVILRTLPPSKQPIGLSLFSITATFAPSIGPTIGGWLTDNYGWEYIFYINVIPGLLLIAGVWYGLAPKPMQLNLLYDLRHGNRSTDPSADCASLGATPAPPPHFPVFRRLALNPNRLALPVGKAVV